MKGRPSGDGGLKAGLTGRECYPDIDKSGGYAGTEYEDRTDFKRRRNAGNVYRGCAGCVFRSKDNS